MEASTMNNPLTAPPPTEVPLSNAPLAQVLCQIRFPLIAAIGQRDYISDFQEAIRKTYPVLREQKTQNIVFEGFKPPEMKESTLWQFTDLKNNWKISLASEFIAIETNAYTSRTEFLNRLDTVLTALKTHIDPAQVDRLGVRYIDQIKGEEFTKLSMLIRQEVLGLMSSTFQDQMQHHICEASFVLPQAMLLARWGQLPPHQSFDPSSLPPIPQLSWILDLDMSNQEPRAFDVKSILIDVEEFSTRIYTFFRWVVTDEFLREFGGEI
jgi:uncharacterized protein (TIGR04255 family)